MVKSKGISLAEIIITLVVLAVISALAIPKVMEAHKVHQTKSVVKETIMALSNAMTRYKLDQDVTAETNPVDLLPYMNYVNLKTTGTIDIQGGNTGTTDCGAADEYPCAMMHNGSALWFYRGNTTTWGNKFGGTANTHYILFYLDPDGEARETTVTTGLSKSMAFIVYTDGRVRTGCDNDDRTWWNGSLVDWCPDANEVGSWWDDGGYDPTI